MSEISVYDIVPTPKLADKLIGTSVGGVIPDVTYNFTLEELLQLFIPNIPANTLQGVLDYGNTATQDINLTGTINTTDLNVFATANILDSILSGETHITGELYDGLDSKGTAGQVLTSTGSGVEWYTIPTVIPTLQQVLQSGNTSDISIILTANITAVTATATNVVSNTSLSVNGVLKDGTASAGGSNQILSSTGSNVQWVDMPLYNAVSPLLYDNPTKTFSIQVANASQGGYLSNADWINFDGKQDAISLTTTGTSGAATFVGNTLNIPVYTPDLSGYVPESRTLTINGVTYDLSANRSWTIAAGVAEVTATAPLSSSGGAYPDISISQSDSSTDGYLSSEDWLTFNSKQDALDGGTGLVKSTSGTISYITDNSTNWNTAYNESIVSAAVTGTSTKLLTLNQQDGGTITASWSDADTGLTSVGLTMPSAFTVTNSPLTSNGTIGVTGAGTTAQYVRGDGSLANFPSIVSEAQRLVTEVYNETGATLTKGTVVYINGGHGNLPTITKAIATGDATSAQTYGVVQTDITNNNNGFVVAIGGLENIDTQAYADGTQLYLSSTVAGAWTSVKQYAPAHLVYVGIVVRSHPTQGVVEIRIQNGFEMDELHNVFAQNPNNNAILQYKTATSLWTSVDGTTTNIAEGTNLYYLDSRARAAISLTTTGSSGAATYNNTTGVFNIPNYGSALTAYVPYTGATANVNLGAYNLTADSLIKSGGTSGQFLKADGSVDSSAYITLGSLSAAAPLSYDNSIGAFSISQAGASADGYLSSTDWTTFNSKQAAGDYITSLTGEATGTGPGATAVTLNNASVTGKVLTGVNITGGSVVATDTMLTAFGKLQNQINGLIGSTIYQGVWNATTNTPTLASGVGTRGYYYIVNVAGNTNLNGITDWQIGDWAIFDGTAWQKVDNTESVTSVNGFTGAVSLTTDNIAEGTTNLYFANSLARSAVSLTTTGSSGAATYNNTTGIFNIPNYGSALSDYLPLTGGTLTGGLYINPVDTGVVGLDVASDTIRFRSDNAEGFKRQLTTTMSSGTLVKMQAAGFGGTYVTDLGFYTSSSSALNTTPNLYLTGGNNRVGVNTDAPAYTLDVVGTGGYSGALTADSFVKIGGTSVQFLMADGSVTTSPSASGYVPYTGATTDVDLGNFDLNTAHVTVNGGGGGGVVNIFKNGSRTIAGNGYISLYADNAAFGFLDSISGNTRAAQFSLLSITNNTTVTLTIPDASGTIALVGGAGVGTVTSVAALTLGTTGTDLSSSVANSTTTPVITLNVPTASATNRGALSAADWTTFNSKQNALTNPVTGTGTTNTIPKFTGATTLGNSIIYENATGIGIGTNGPLARLHVDSTAALTAIFDCSASDTYVSWQNDTSSFGDIGSAASLATGGASNDFAIRARSTYNIIFATNATEKMRLTNGGKLGIGTTTVPTGRLLGVSGGAQFNGAALMEGANFSIIPAVNGQDGVILNVGYDTGTDYGSLFINTGGNTSMTLTKNGNVTFAGTATATSIIKVGGTSSQFLMADGSTSTGPAGGITGSGTANYVPKFTGASAIGNSLLQSETSRVFINQENSYFGIDAQDATRIGFVKKGGAQPFVAYAADAFTIRSTVGTDIGYSNTFVTKFSMAINGDATFTNSVISLSSITGSGVKPQLTASGGTTAGAGILLSNALATSPTARRNWGIFTEDQIEGDFVIKSSTAAGTNPEAGNTRLAILSSGYVGVNMTTPIYQLDVTSSTYKSFRVQANDDVVMTFGSTIASSQYWSMTATSNGSGQGSNVFFIGRSTSNPSGLLTKDFTLNSNGSATFSNSVGIGGASLGDILHIMRNGTTSYAAMRVTNSSSTADVYFGLGGSAVANTDLRNNAYVMNAAASGLAFGTSDAVRMFITSGGNTLIGTTTDSGYKLNVNGGINLTASNWLTFDGKNTIYSTGGVGFFIQQPDGSTPTTFRSSTGATQLTIGTGSGAATFSSSVTANGDVTINGNRTLYMTNAGVAAGSLVFYNNTSSTIKAGVASYYNVADEGDLEFLAGGSGTKMIIRSSGNVGIGTTSPNSLFEINKSSNSGSGSAFPRINVINSLATQGDGSSTYNFADIHLSSGNGAVDMYLSTTYAAGTWAPAGILNVATNHDLQFKTNNAERMRILNTGDIQFPNSFAFKSIASSGYIAMYANGGGLYWGGAASTNQMHLNSSGNLGIGTTSPTRGLTINRNNEFAALNIVKNNTGNQIVFLGTGSSGPDDLGILQLSDGGSVKVQIYSGGVSYINAGNVLIGTTTDNGHKLRISGNTYSSGYMYTASEGTGFAVDANTDASQARVGLMKYGGFEGMLVSGAGTVIRLAHRTDSEYVLTGGTPSIRVDLLIATTGAATFSSSVTATSFFESSDKTIKTLIEDNYQTKGIESVVAKLYTKNGKQELGYYAQDVQGILPSAVSKGEDGLLSLSYREVHTAKIARLEKEVEELKSQLARL